MFYNPRGPYNQHSAHFNQSRNVGPNNINSFSISQCYFQAHCWCLSSRPAEEGSKEPHQRRLATASVVILILMAFWSPTTMRRVVQGASKASLNALWTCFSAVTARPAVAANIRDSLFTRRKRESHLLVLEVGDVPTVSLHVSISAVIYTPEGGKTFF